MNKIKDFLKDNRKVIMMAVFLLVFVAACTSVRNQDGTVDKTKLISMGTNGVPFTSYMDSISDGWFNAIVWPVAQLINVVAGFSDAGIGIIAVTFLLNFGTAAMSIKQQVASQKMQLLQPDIQKIQKKYEGKTDQNSRMKMAQEQQAIYKKYDINPLGSMVTMFIQLPIIMAVYQAVQRAVTVEYGSFFGVSLMKTPMQGIQSVDVAIIIIFVLMVLFQFIQLKLPQFLAKRREKNSNVKTKAYAQPEQKKGGMQGSMNMMMYFSIGMIVFLSLNWPLGMTFYWLVSSITRVIQNIVIQKYFIKDM